MKDYEHIVVWLDYFNKNLKRSSGRRLGLKKCVYDPSLKELADAASAAGLKIAETNDKVRYPRRAFVRSGYIVLPKASSKTKTLEMISQRLVAKRVKQSK